MTRSRSNRQRNLEDVAGDLGQAKVWWSPSRDSWCYQIKCRSCWKHPPREKHVGERVCVLTDSWTEAVSAWQHHEATAHSPQPDHVPGR